MKSILITIASILMLVGCSGETNENKGAETQTINGSQCVGNMSNGYSITLQFPGKSRLELQSNIIVKAVSGNGEAVTYIDYSSQNGSIWIQCVIPSASNYLVTLLP